MFDKVNHQQQRQYQYHAFFSTIRATVWWHLISFLWVPSLVNWAEISTFYIKIFSSIEWCRRPESWIQRFQFQMDEWMKMTCQNFIGHKLTTVFVDFQRNFRYRKSGQFEKQCWNENDSNSESLSDIIWNVQKKMWPLSRVQLTISRTKWFFLSIILVL